MSGGRGRPTRCWPATAGSGGGRDHDPADPVGHQRHRDRQDARRGAAGGRRAGVRPGAHPGRRRPRRSIAEEAQRAATTAAAAHPCRLLVVVRRRVEADDRLDAEVQVGGRLGANEAVMMRMYGRLALHAESVVLPLLASDAPVVTWWHGADAGQARLRRARRARRPGGSPTPPPRARTPWPRSSGGPRTTRPATPTWPGPGPRRGGRCWPRRSTTWPRTVDVRRRCTRSTGTRAPRCSPAG